MPEPGEIVVMFASKRNGADDAGYQAAAEAMEALACVQPGYRGIVSSRGTDGFVITISHWADVAAAIAWRDHPDHAAIRDMGRAVWYDSYQVTVCEVTRSYDWQRGG
jgi:heme-degrading monooxygenase HmoA